MKQNYFRQTIAKLALLMAFSYTISVGAQTPSWQWAKNSAGGSVESNQASAADQNGNVYISGYYQSDSMTFGSSTVTNTNSGSRDSFIVKYDATGNVLWAKNIGGAKEQQILGMWADQNGNLCITGDFSSDALTIDGISVNNTEINGDQDIFMAKLDSSGTAAWVKSFGGTYYDYGYCITTDSAGNVFLGGIFFSASINVGGITVYNTEVNDDHDVFFAKFDSMGNPQWVQAAGGSSYEAIESMTVDTAGNLYIAGIFYSPTFNIQGTILNNTNDYGDSFLLKYTTTGDLTWAKTIGGTSYDNIRAVKTDDAGNIFVAGHFESPTVSLGSLSLNNAGTTGNDAFIAKYNSSGEPVWARRAGGINSDFATDLVLDSTGNPCIVGSFSSPTIAFGNLSPLPTNGGFDLFVAKYTKDGTPLWSKNTGGGSSEFAYTAAIGNDDQLFVTGHAMSATVNFDTQSINCSGTTIYVAKLNIGTLATASFEKNQLRVYPNPTSNILYIEADGLIQNAAYTISDVNGRLLSTSLLLGNTGIDVSHLQSGIYFIGLDNQTSIKFIKE